MERFNKVLVIIRRSNGDVFLSEPLLRVLKESYNAKIDLLINKDTKAIAKTIPYIDNIFCYDYKWKGINKIINEIKLFWKIFKKYNLAINLTSNDRNVRYASFSTKYSISVIDKEIQKNWWKKLILNNYYYQTNQHIVLQNMMPLKFLNIFPKKIEVKAYYNKDILKNLHKKFSFLKDEFIIFHPSAQYNYKIYPKHLRNKLLEKLSSLNIPIIITGGNSKIDKKISSEIPKLKNIHNIIGQTTLEEYIAISDKSLAYIGMDTLNMHIAAAQNKKIFAIFGPTFHQVWSRWSNQLQIGANSKPPIQEYGNITLFQANLQCVPCGKAGCDDNHGISECLYQIHPETIFQKVKSEIKN